MNALRNVLLLVAVGSATVLGPIPQARPDVIYLTGDTYAAIAYSPSTGKVGYAYNYGSRWSAEKAALNNCPVSDARIVTWVNNGFCAIAVGDDKSCWGTGYSYGDGASTAFAKQRAINECSKRTTNPRIAVCICSQG
ncbi:MAG: DUF4189 domain-containing protein [Gemmataceae bacterium]|nr:DUF4189 domain-containing protein [Gemmataceae bacterium]